MALVQGRACARARAPRRDERLRAGCFASPEPRRRTHVLQPPCVGRCSYGRAVSCADVFRGWQASVCAPLCRLDLDDKVPDHSTFSVNRHGRFRNSDILRQVFEAVVRACMDAGLVKGEGFAVDASVMEANASRYRGKAPDEIAWAEPERQTRAVKEYLAALEAETEPNPDRKLPKVISPSDPSSACLRRSRITAPQRTLGRKRRERCAQPACGFRETPPSAMVYAFQAGKVG